MNGLTSPLLDAALAYARHGWPVLPLHTAQPGRCSCGRSGCTSIGKHPRTAHGLKDATTDECVIRARWAQRPTANVGVVTGSTSGLVVLDIDPRHRGDESYAALERLYGKLPQTAQAFTGGGGRHLLFQHPGGFITSKPIAPGLDIKADGGYIVAPPSLHASGRTYQWDDASPPYTLPLTPIPSCLLALLRPRSGLGIQNRSSSDWLALIRQGTSEGDRNNSVAALAGHLLFRGVDPIVTLELVLAWNTARNQPPLPDDEVRRTVNSVGGCELRRRQKRSGYGFR